ncbi:MAG TPA: hypothetical protein PKJ98_11380 [Verrucomicrobiota bacterium]|nr:hypothetical protein [Verrucomicrobiota bacterium]
MRASTQVPRIVVVTPEPDGTALLGALRKVVFTLRGWEVRAHRGEARNTTGPLAETTPQRCVGLIIALTEEEFWSRLLPYAGVAIPTMVVASPFGPDWQPWKGLSVVGQGALRDRCRCCTLEVTEILEAIDRAMEPGGEPESSCSAQDFCGRIVVAKALHRRLGQFIHGGKNDLANTVIGPARMLLESGREPGGATPGEIEAWFAQTKEIRLGATSDQAGLPRTALLAEFRRQVLDPSGMPPGGLLTELSNSFGGVERLLGQPKPPDPQEPLDELDRFLVLLTEIRHLAGEPAPERASGVDPEPAAPVNHPGGGGSHDAFRLLVVDDHAALWRGVFEVIARMLVPLFNQKPSPTGTRGVASVIIDFSRDATWIDPPQPDEERVPLWQFLPEYDLMLLDICLPGERTGLDLLGEIRERLGDLPVLLWTSSLDPTLASEATLDNGYLYKKTATCAQVARTIGRWLATGRARRLISLPNPFFDHVIRGQALRACALDFTHWCLKCLDGFHAVDQVFFKFYNDHGGRHIVALLSYLERLLHPVLFVDPRSAPEEDRSVFSTTLQEREIEILCLYLAALCHELGMFPIAEHDLVEDVPSSMKSWQAAMAGGEDARDKALKGIRKLHAPLGCLLLSTPDAPPPDLQELIRTLASVGDGSSGTSLLSRVAVLTAFHARALPLTPKAFAALQTAGRFEEPDRATLVRRFSNAGSADAESAVQTLERCLGQHLGWVASHGDRSAVERLRRLCAMFRFADAIDIDRSRVPADFITLDPNRPPTQDPENCKRQVVEAVAIERGSVSITFNAASPNDMKLELQRLLPAGNVTLWDGFDETPIGEAVRRLASLSGDPSLAAKDPAKALDEVRPQLEAWMADQLTQPPERRVQGLIPTVAALAVLCDVIEEYQAIADNHLAQRIRLGRLRWNGREAGSERVTLARVHPPIRRH